MNSPQEFEWLFAGVRRLQASNFECGGALVTITRTLGSTFRHAGTSMLVNSDGSTVCALSGGCPQRDIVARAQRVMESDTPEIAKYNRDSGLDVLMEIGCGGELDVLIEPVASAQDILFFEAIALAHRHRVAGFIATVFARHGMALAPRPQRLVWAGSVQMNGIRDPALADQILSIGTDLDARSHTSIRSLQTTSASVDVLLEALCPVHTLIMIGANAVSAALSNISVRLGWKTLLIDQQELPAEMATLQADVKFLNMPPQLLQQMVSLDRFSSVVIMTFNIERDIAYLNALANTPVAYLGAIGSRERAARMRVAMLANDCRLHAPAGLDVGAETPEEIAVAVAAEILATLNARAGGSLNGVSNAIHAQ